ncbi:MAG TPA: 3-phenylpropionate/cinnamic acid dioxygenase subunit beta [Candidatus Binatia bacterium]|jgi:3-phenylpropionate/cinnamic acid dioxygenase small subunit
MQNRVELEREIQNFLYHEAELLDSRKFEQWLELLTDDIAYEMPVRLTRERDRSDAPSGMAHFSEDRRTLELRVNRLKTDYAWAENPPSRTRRFVSNVRIEQTSESNEVIVRSYLLLYRSRGSSTQTELISAERIDFLRNVEGQWKLAKRTITVDQAVLDMQNLAIFF